LINIKLPWPPTVNTYYTIARNRKILSKRGREYKKEVAVLLLNEDRSVTGRVEVYIDAFPPDKRKRDIDNIIKPLLDCLTDASVWGDDSQVDVLRIRRKEITKPGYVRVYISEIGQDT